MNIEQKIKKMIRDVPDFPHDGIIFKDVTPLLSDPVLSNEIIETLIDRFSNVKIDAIVAIESRGFFYGFLLANKLNVPFIPVRKKGKLPGETYEFTYELEYGTATVEIHMNDIKAGWNILIHDDLLATGGTAQAASELIKMQKGKVVGYAFVMELSFLQGREKLQAYCDNIISLATY